MRAAGRCGLSERPRGGLRLRGRGGQRHVAAEFHFRRRGRRRRLDGGETIDASYKYLGLGTIVEEDYEQADVKLTHLDGSGSVTGLDRFGRVVDQKWTNDARSAVFDEYTYTYDRAGNRTGRDNELNHALDEGYQYDQLDRLGDWLDSLGNSQYEGTGDSRDCAKKLGKGGQRTGSELKTFQRNPAGGSPSGRA
jgi:hypothetical protein